MTAPDDRLPMPSVERELVPRTRPYLDVAELPDLAFGSRDLMWWGTVAFMVIEGFTLALCATVYLYLWKNFSEWPPAGTEHPTLLWPLVQLGVMAVSLVSGAWTYRAAKRFDFERVRFGQTVAAILVVAMSVLRLLELQSLHAKWSMNAYASAAWLVVGSHGTLIAVKAVESIGFALEFWFAPIEKKHFSDVADDVFYWYFLVLTWVPLFLLCYVGPWLMS
jgi:heme/copper-type cytochrome/quinol oxidase subunit 3